MTFRLYLTWLKPFRMQMLAILGLSLLTAVLQWPIPLVFKYMVDTVFIAGDALMLGVCVGALLTLIAIGSLLELFATMLSLNTHERFRSDLRRQVYAQIQNLSFVKYTGFMSGELTSRLVKDLDELARVLPSGIAGFVRNLSLSLGLIAVLFVLNWQMTLGLSVTIPFFVMVFIVAQKKLRSLSRVTLETQAAMQSGLQEKIEGLRDIQLSNAQEFQEQHAAKIIQESELSKRHLQVQQAKLDASMVVFQLVGTFVIWGLGGWMTLQGHMSVGEIIGFSYAVNYLFGPFSAVFQYISGIHFEVTALVRLADFFVDNPPPIADLSTLPPLKGHICFENVGFGYTEDRPVLHQISFDVGPGESLGILGASGVGKTTLLSLLVKLLHPQSGRILLDGCDIATIPDAVLRQGIGFVPQDVFLFQGTLRDNILMGRTASNAMLGKACQLSGISALEKRLPEGLETVIGEKGSRLSGGERQRVAIARALLTDPQLIILDEPSNNLDGESKARLQQSLILAREGKTLILVTHDRTLVEGVNKILTLKKREEKGPVSL